MPKFVILLSDKNKELFTETLLNEHVEHLQRLKDSEILRLCGPFKDNMSAIQIISADTLSEAKAIIQRDPFVKSNYYESVEIRELIEATPENNWLMSHPQTEEKRKNNKTNK